MALDGQINFRVDQQLKQHFSRLCKVERVSMSEAVSSWMEACVRAGTVIGIDQIYSGQNLGERLEQIEQRLTASHFDKFGLTQYFIHCPNGHGS